jgi:hypothetical protein
VRGAEGSNPPPSSGESRANLLTHSLPVGRNPVVLSRRLIRKSARRGPSRIKRVEQLGFEEILIGSQFGALEEIERVRDFLKS